MPVSANELAEIWKLEEQYPGTMKEMMKMQLAENPDSVTGPFLKEVL